jgi:hypothetical protein
LKKFEKVSRSHFSSTIQLGSQRYRRPNNVGPFVRSGSFEAVSERDALAVGGRDEAQAFHVNQSADERGTQRVV